MKAYNLLLKSNESDSKSHGPYKIVDLLDQHTAILEILDGKRFQNHVDKQKVAYE